MLKFIFGRAATGKSYSITEKICADVFSNKNTVLLVPEQFTFESEKALLKALGNRASTDVSVLSFTRLYDEITRNVGGRVANNITENDKIVLMNRAFKSVRDRLSVFQKYVNSSRFTQNLISAINEFKTAAVSPEDLELALKDISGDYLKLKLKDMSIIYAAYNSILGNSFLDPVDDLTRLNEKLFTFRYFEGKNVYIDSFKNFTGQQYKILERILSQADNVYISVTSDDINSTEISLFSNVNDTAKKIMNIAEKYSVKIDKPEIHNENFYKSKGIMNLERLLSGKISKFENTEGLSLVKCANFSDEAEFTARTIRRLVREKGYRFRDFVIISRNAETHQKFIEKHCKNNGVFCFTDRRRKITDLPFVVFINSALNLLTNFSTDEILSFHKTALTNLSIEEISDLENYAYLWNLKGSEWLEEWTMNPKGFVANEQSQENNNLDILKRLNELRIRAVEPIIAFKKDFHGTPENLCRAIINLLRANSVQDKLKAYADNLKAINLKIESDDLRLGYDAIIDLINSLVKCLPSTEISITNFTELWKIALESITIGNIPQMVDEVTFGSADRIKPSRPKVAFLLGVNAGIFPAYVGSSGIFAAHERTAMINSGIEISDYGVNKVLDEEFLLYSALCCPTEKLFISFASADNSGALLEPSQVISEITSACDSIKVFENNSEMLKIDNLPETEYTARSLMYGYYSLDKSAYLTIKDALLDSNSVESSIAAFSKDNAAISSEKAVKLFGDKINMSATAFDTFHRCRFSYFCRYGLGLKKIQPADFDVLQRGTLSHYVLENLVKRFLDRFDALTREQTNSIVDDLVSEYLSLIDGYDKIETKRTQFLVSIIAASLKDVSYHIVREMRQCDFKPEFFELKIGRNGTISTLRVPFSENGEMLIRGSIDRVDIYGDYVRIIDYKTGTKVFKLPDILVGLNLQMLIYLYAVVRGDNKYLNSKNPAGILYMPSKRDFGDSKVLSMNGLILLDEEVIEAMDKEGDGEFIPKKPFKSDGTLKSRVTSFAESTLFKETFDYIELLIKRMGNSIHNGDFSADPTDSIDTSACKYCDFSSICCFEKSEHKCSNKSLSPAEVLEILKGANNNGV